MEIAAVIGILFFLGIIIALIPLVAAAFGDTETAEEVGKKYVKASPNKDTLLGSLSPTAAADYPGNLFIDKDDVL